MTAFKKSTGREYFESIVIAVILALFIRTFLALRAVNLTKLESRPRPGSRSGSDRGTGRGTSRSTGPGRAENQRRGEQCHPGRTGGSNGPGEREDSGHRNSSVGRASGTDPTGSGSAG